MSYLFTGGDWTVELIDKIWTEVDRVGTEMGLTYYKPQIEIITPEQMIDNYSTVALPVMYPHWSFGKSFVQQKRAYDKGNLSIAYEIVINTDPAICYIVENNTATMQALVLAHAAVGHSSFFKNNYLFKQFTDATTIIQYLIYAREYIMYCEDTYGAGEVEQILDAAHSLQSLAVDKYNRPDEKSQKQIQELLSKNKEIDQQNKHWLYDALFHEPIVSRKEEEKEFEEQENILKYIRLNSPVLTDWQRKCLKIVETVAQYFYPQSQTKVSNEGWASFVHYQIMNALYDQNLLTDESMLEFLHSHTSVLNQSVALKTTYVRNPFNQNDIEKRIQQNERYSGLNPYKLGFSIYMDIKRICENPTEEDKQWFPDLIGMDWKEAVYDAMSNYRDDSFIRTFLSPKVIRDLGLVRIKEEEEARHWTRDKSIIVSEIHDDEGYETIRRELSTMYARDYYVPNIVVTKSSGFKAGTLELKHYPYYGMMLNKQTVQKTLYAVDFLWGSGVVLESWTQDGSRFHHSRILH